MALTLSERGRKYASVGEEDLEFTLIRDNPYDAATNPSGIISLGTADNVSTSFSNLILMEMLFLTEI